MSVEIKIETEEFARVLKQWAVLSKKELADELNRRMFFLMVRLYVLVPPKNPQAERNKIRAYLNEEMVSGPRRFDKKTGKRIGKARAFRRINKLINAAQGKRGRPGLYGDAMKKAAAKIRARSIGSVGYLKSAIVKSIVAFNGHFKQFGGRSKKANGKDISPNAALVKIAADYGVYASAGNVGMHKGAKCNAKPARPGFNPEASVALSIGLGDFSQFGTPEQNVEKVDAIYGKAIAQAMRDERAEMEARLGDAVDSAANQACAESPNGRAD